MPKKKSSKSETYHEAIGRRRTAVARVRLYVIGASKELRLKEQTIKKGEIVVNGLSVKQYFSGDVKEHEYMRPLTLTDNADRFAISAVVKGGGKDGQLDAVVLGISRALLLNDESHRAILKKEGLLTRDARARERRKVGTGGKARRKKQSPKR